MPIKPENKNLYPANWLTEIRPRILARAGDKCEFCGVKNHAIGYRNDNGEFNEIEQSFAGDIEANEAEEKGWRTLKIILTIAHLDHNPENCNDENLKALCQRCHNRYDRKHRNQTARTTRAKKQGLQQLFT